jgi:hypothetical protein
MKLCIGDIRQLVRESLVGFSASVEIAIKLEKILQEMEEVKTARPYMFRIVKLLKNGRSIPRKMGFQLLKDLRAQYDRGFYEGDRSHSYNRAIGQTNPSSIYRESWHELNELIYELGIAFFGR